MIARLMTQYRQRISSWLTFSLLSGVFVMLPSAMPAANAAACASGVVTPLHRPDSTLRPFYTEFAPSIPERQSNYAGYRISSTISDPYLKFTGFSSKLALATKQSPVVKASALSQNSSYASDHVAYVYLRGTETTSAQSFTVSVYSGNPDSGGTLECTYTDGFSKVEDIISASANKVLSMTKSGSIVDGGTFTVTVRGNPGQVGADTVDKFGSLTAFHLAASMEDAWDADHFVLQGIQMRYGNAATIAGSATFTNFYDVVRAYVTPSGVDAKEYEVTYTFYFTKTATSASPTVSKQTFKPRQAIYSGGAYKYNAGFEGTPLDFELPAGAASGLTVEKSLLTLETATVDNCASAATCYKAGYSVKVTNQGTAVTGIVLIDTPTTSGTWSFVAGSEKKDSITTVSPDTATVTVSDITFKTFDLAASGAAGDSATFEYSLYITKSTDNTAVAQLSGTSYSSNKVTAAPLAIITEELTSPPAGSNDWEDPLDYSGGIGPCTWSVSSGTLPAWLKLSTDGTLSIDTSTVSVAGIYTFTLRVDCSGDSSYDTQAYTLYVPHIKTTSLPDACTSESYSKTMEIEYNDPAKDVTWSASGLPSGLSINSSTGAITGTASTAGSYSVTISATTNGATVTKTLTLTVASCGGGGGGYSPPELLGQTITFPPVTDKTWGDPNPSSTPTASSGLPVTVTNNTPSVCTYSNGVITILSVGTCSLTATQPGNGTYSAATPVTITFRILPAPVTVTADSKEKVQGATDPTLTYTVTGLVRGDTVTGITVTRGPGETPGSYAIVPAGGTFTANYTVTYRNGTLTITAPPAPRDPGAGTYTPTTISRTIITWNPSATPNVTYRVDYNGRSSCTTAATTCTVNFLIGPASTVLVTAIDTAGKTSAPTKMSFKLEKLLLATTVYFAVDSSKLTAKGKSDITRVVKLLNKEGFNRLVINGYTDSSASATYNLALSKRRSIAVEKYADSVIPGFMAELGSWGLTRAAASNKTAAGRALNRRTTLEAGVK